MNDRLTSYREAELGVEALAAAATELLGGAGIRAEDERVADRLDARLVRYYQTLGVIDRPLRQDGRRALYGFRHLVQLLAARLLQARGQTLAQVQAGLLGASTERLEAAVREALGAPAPTPPPGPAPIPWITAEVAPGVLVTVDSRRVPEPDALLARIAGLLGGGNR